MINHLMTGLMHATVIEDGMKPGAAMPALQTFLWFVAAPIALFVGISVIVIISSADRRKSYSSGDLTRID
jgi:hypothetical protein